MSRRDRRPAGSRPRVRSDDGTIVLWLLGLSVLLLGIGGLGVDLWRAVDERRAVAAVADAAATAGASGLDVDVFRRDGAVVLDPALAERLGAAVLGDADRLVAWDVDATPAAVRTVATGHVRLTLLRLLAPGTDGLDVTVTAVAEPRASG